MPLVNSTRSRLLELNVEYRDTMIHLKVRTNIVQVHVQADSNCRLCAGARPREHLDGEDPAAGEDWGAALPAGDQGLAGERPLPCHRQTPPLRDEPAQGELPLPPHTRGD